MAAPFATLTEEEIRQMNEEATPANTKSTCLATRFGKYQSLAYTKSVNSVFRVL